MLCPTDSDICVGELLRRLSPMLSEFERKYGDRLREAAGEGAGARLCRLAGLLKARMDGDWGLSTARIVGFGVFSLTDLVKMSRRVFRDGADGVSTYLCEPAESEASYVILAPCCHFVPLEGDEGLTVVAASQISRSVRRLFDDSTVVMLR